MNTARKLVTVLRRGGNRPVSVPDAAFSFLPFSIYANGNGTFNVGDWDISAQVSRSGGERYVSKTGNDTTGNGLSWGTAWKTLSKAYGSLAAVPNSCIHVGAGKYGWIDGSFSDNHWIDGRSLIGYGDVIIDSYFIQNAYSQTAGKTYTYQSACTIAITIVLDYGNLDSNGDPDSYSPQTSIDDVESNAGSFFYDGVEKILYVHCIGDGAPDSDIRSQFSGSNFGLLSASNLSVYAENIKVYCCPINIANNSGSNSGIVYFNNCRFMFSTNTTPVNVAGYTVFFNSCQYAHQTASGDLMGGGVSNGVISKIVEINCKGWDGGNVAYSGSNASTNHNAGINVFVNGEYYDTFGAPIGLIDDGKAWFLGTYSHDSKAVSDPAYNTNFQLFVEAWLDTCRSENSTYDIICQPTSTLHLHNFDSGGQITGTPTIIQY